MSEDEYNTMPSGSLTTPTFSCYMRANPFSREKAEYLKTHHRRMKEFGPRPYMTGDYPELPRHYPGVRVVYDWDQVDAVTDRLYYIPQRWTYHRDHLTLPTAKARRELPPQDIDHAKSATLRGVVSYAESQRRAASPSPCRPPGARRPPLPGSAVSRAMSQGSTLTYQTQTRGRHQRPRTCLPRARTPQPGEEQPTVHLTPLIPRKPPTGLPSRSQTPSSTCSDQTLENADNRSGRSPTWNSSYSRPSRSISRPATATTTETRKNRSLSRPSTAVSRRTRWSDIADDTVSLNSSILELLQTITATDGKLRPLSPRACRTRHQKARNDSPESVSSGYLYTNVKTYLRPNSGFDAKQRLGSNCADLPKGVYNGPNQADNKYDISTRKGGDTVKSGAQQSNVFSSSSNYQEAPNKTLKDGKNETTNGEGSWQAPGLTFFSPEQANDRATMGPYPNTKSACIDFGDDTKIPKLTEKDNSINIEHCSCPKKHDTEMKGDAHCNSLVLQEKNSGQICNAVKQPCTPVGQEVKEKDSPYTSKTSNTHEVNVDLSDGSSEELNTAEADTAHQKNCQFDQSKFLNSSSLSGNIDVPALVDKLEVPLSLSQSADSCSGTSSGSSSSQAEYLLVSGSSNTGTAETENQYRSQADTSLKHEAALSEFRDEQNKRGEDSD